MASITVVAFNGIQDRAYVTQVYSKVEAHAKLMNLYNEANGNKYPNEINTNCIGNISDYPAADGFALGSCGKIVANGTTWGQASNTLASTLRTIGNSPVGTTKIATNSGVMYRGIYFEYADNPTGPNADWVFYEFVVRGNQTCPTKTYTSRYTAADNSTYCSYIFYASGS